MSLFIQTADTHLETRKRYFSLDEWVAGEFEHLLAFDSSFNLKSALKKLIKKSGDIFPVVQLGKGRHASVWLTGKGTVIRIPTHDKDFGGEYLKDCFRSSAPKSWMPVVHAAVSCSDKLWVVEVERLYDPVQGCTDERIRKLLKAWDKLAIGDRPFRDEPEVVRLLNKVYNLSGDKDPLPFNANFVLWLAFIPDSRDLKVVCDEEVLFEGPFVKDLAWLLRSANKAAESHKLSYVRLDVYGLNIMARAGTNELVLTDPFFV